MQEIASLWDQMPISRLWRQMPLHPFRPWDTELAESSDDAAPVNTWERDLQVNPWTRDKTDGKSFSDIFRTALEERVEPVAALADPITDIFGAAVQSVKETDAEKVQLEYLMATGQLDNPALLSIASTKAQTSVQLLVQLRNRALDAYNEVMRISV